MERDEAEAWRLGLVVFDLAFARAQGKAGAAIPCAKGCSSCCAGASLFEIHAADAALLRAGLEASPAPVREEVVRRSALLRERLLEAARRLAEEGERLLQDWGPDDGLGSLPARVVERLADATPGACPVLDEAGACALHAHRPAICRLQGAGWKDPVTEGTLPDFCDLGGRLERPSIEAPLHRLDELREDLRLRLAAREPELPARTFVAAVLR